MAAGNKANELEILCIGTLNITKHQLYLWQIDNAKKNIKDIGTHVILAKIESALTNSAHCDRSPSEMWKEHFPTSGMFNDDLHDLHAMYYEYMKMEFGYLVDCILNERMYSQKELSTIAIFVGRVYPIFCLPESYKSGKSTYWHDSPEYAKWKDVQRSKIDYVKKEIKRLSKLYKENQNE